jgi:hypothetical protein
MLSAAGSFVVFTPEETLNIDIKVCARGRVGDVN